GTRGASGVDDDQPRPVPNPSQDVVEEDGVGLAGIRAPQHDEIAVLDLLVRAGPASRSEYRRQTDDRGSVSGAVAAVDVVGAEDLPDELLRQEVHLVRCLRTAERPDAPPGVALGGDPEARSRAVERLVPGRRPELAALANQGRSEPGLSDPHPPSPCEAAKDWPGPDSMPRPGGVPAGSAAPGPTHAGRPERWHRRVVVGFVDPTREEVAVRPVFRFLADRVERAESLDP